MSFDLSKDCNRSADNGDMSGGMLSSISWFQTEKDASTLLISYNSIAMLVCVPTALVLGIISDSMQQRRMLLQLPIVGQSLSILFVTIDYHIMLDSYALLYVSAFVNGLFGSYVLFIAGAAALICDHTAVENRLNSFALLETISRLTYGIGNLIIGFWLTDGFLGPVWFIFGISVLAGIPAFYLEEPETLTDETIIESTSYEMFSVFRKIPLTLATFSRLFSSRLSLMMCIYFIIYILYAVPVTGQDKLIVMFFQTNPYCLSSESIAVILFIIGFSMAIGTFVLTRYYPHRFDDYQLCYMGYVSLAVGSLGLAFSSTELQALLGKHAYMDMINYCILVANYYTYV